MRYPPRLLLGLTSKMGARPALLDRGEIYINQARGHLLEGKRDNYWWPRLYILEARLQVERLELSARRAGDAPVRKDPIDLYVRDGLAAIRSALESISDDDQQRLDLIQGLWKTLVQSLVYARHRHRGEDARGLVGTERAGRLGTRRSASGKVRHSRY